MSEHKIECSGTDAPCPAHGQPQPCAACFDVTAATDEQVELREEMLRSLGLLHRIADRMSEYPADAMSLRAAQRAIGLAIDRIDADAKVIAELKAELRAAYYRRT